MPELPEGTINAFIQNKNLAKYGLLKDNEGGFLAENFVVRTCVEINRCVGCTGIATPSSRRRIDGVEVDAKIQHERAVKF